jgi:hypothetical protein
MSRKDHAVLFWGPNKQGYTYNVSNAGKYSEDDIEFIDSDHFCDDMPILCEVIDKLSIESVIDNSMLGKIVINNKTNCDLIGIKPNELLSGSTVWDSGAFCTPERFLYNNKNTLDIISQINSNKAWKNR